MSRKQSDYELYLLRLWRDDGDEGKTWRASLDRSLTGERRSFANLSELFTFLWQQTVEGCDRKGEGSATKDERGALPWPPTVPE